MYLLYLDESENANQDRKSITTPNVFGLSGLLVTSRYVTTVVDEINEIKKKYQIPTDWEIHTYEIFSGTSKWKKKLTDDQRRNLCREFAGLVAKNNRLAKSWFCYKESNLIKEDYLVTLDGIIKKTCSFIGSKKGSTGKQIMIIFDEKDDLENSINQFVQKERDDINKSKNGKKCRIIDHGFPGKSSFSELLQLTDFVGYVFRLSKTLKRTDTLFDKKQNQLFIDFVDELVEIMKKKVVVDKIK